MGTGLLSAARNAQIEYERKRLRAIIKRYPHVKLVLKEEISVNKRIAGIEVINAWEESYRGKVKWEFDDKPQGGQIQFQEDQEGEYVCWVLLSEFNKRFLASHHPVRIWNYEDTKIEAEIQKLSEEMARGMVYLKKPDENPTLKEINDIVSALNSGTVQDFQIPKLQKDLVDLTEKYQKELKSQIENKPDRLTEIERLLKRSNLTVETRGRLEKERTELMLKNDKQEVVKVE